MQRFSYKGTLFPFHVVHIELFTRVLSLKFHKYDSREKKKTSIPGARLNTAVSKMLSETSGADNARPFKIAWVYLFRRVTAPISEFNCHEIQ